MYQNQNRGRGGFGGQRRFGDNRPSFSRSRGSSFGSNQPRGNRFRVKLLDPRLFIRPAIELENQTEEIQHAFADFNLDERILNSLKQVGFVTPTPIQDKALEPMLNGADLIGLADTGTGKTAAFVLPILAKLIQNREQNALIIAPTRELALQIRDDIRNLSQGLGIYSVLLIGGASIFRQIQELKRSPHIFIGTPGRLKDLHERRVLNFSKVKTVVLDEMDRMLDMGFIKDITKILSLIPTDHQTLLFSATIDERVEGIARNFMVNPQKVSVKTGATAQNVEQNIVKVGSGNKINVLQDLLRKPNFTKVIIFGRTKFGVEKLSVALSQSGFATGSIHGNKRQSQRDRVIRDFKTNQISILIATDVAARGLDIKDISHVINYDQPASYEDYVHRIGRTGRAGKTGQALTFVE